MNIAVTDLNVLTEVHSDVRYHEFRLSYDELVNAQRIAFKQIMSGDQFTIHSSVIEIQENRIELHTERRRNLEAINTKIYRLLPNYQEAITVIVAPYSAERISLLTENISTNFSNG